MEPIPLGHTPAENASRDAVHVPIAPVIAHHRLKPGTHVGLMPDGTASQSQMIAEADLIGIVDPFLLEPVEKGQKFWLCLYPNTITSLRHVWQHKAFKAKVPNDGVFGVARVSEHG